MRFAWIDERPFGYHDAAGSPTGCDIALARAAFNLMGKSFEPVHTTFADLLPGLTDGRWQVSTGMFITPDRSDLAHFTRPIWSLRDGLLVRGAPVDSAKSMGAALSGTAIVDGYRSLAASRGRLAVLRDQVQARHALDCGVPAGHLMVLETYEHACAAVLSGEVDAYASVALAHQQHLLTHPELNLSCVVVPSDEAAASQGGFACIDAETAADLSAALALLLPGRLTDEPSPNADDWPR